MKNFIIIFSKFFWFNFPKSIKDFLFYHRKEINNSSKMLDFPTTFRFDITNKCNANCIFCARQYDNSKKSIMDLDLFIFALKQYFDLGGNDIYLTPTIGEPFLDPLLFKRIKIIKDLNPEARISFNTNGILLENDDNISKLFDLGVNGIAISTAGFDSKMFTRIYRTHGYLNLMNGLKTLLIENKKRGNPINISIELRPDINIFQVFKSADFKYYVAPYLNFRKINWTYHYDNWGASVKQSNLSGYMRLAKEPKRKLKPCRMLNHLVLKLNGEIHVCGCQINPEKPGELCVGNITQQSLKEIWTGERINQIRLSFKIGHPPSVCEKCLGYRP
ncbi:MAG TPA: radical SAM protein [Candidatus Marinimicrobia bacterium]|nr:radical SAM protein [Candidatus Neomarinimicrobiota bacterium]HRS51085.1 radical SAM protein [Candidatus Neomarinimicrobiota bacterium]HRU92591.1 radical SAM protein [Candidatus Neomarinimicrobiota bacterium]